VSLNVLTYDVVEVGVRQYIGGLLLRHICQLVCNAHAITHIERTATDASHVDVSRQLRVATAIYPTVSLMNHSCYPTIISSFHNDTLIVRSVRDIQAGTEIFNCYGPHWKRMCRSERQQLLRDQYFFDCQCEACTERLTEEQLITALLCQHCAGAAVKCADAYKCVECQCNVGNLTSVLARVKLANQLWTQGLEQLEQNLIDGALTLFDRCLELRQSTLYKHNKDLSHLYDAIAQCYAIKGEFGLASKFLSDSLLTTETVYGPTSIELANELLKYAEVCMNAHNKEIARSSAERALQLFTLNYGPECDAASDLRQLINNLILTESDDVTK
jgi:SET and MYND domain-containing protein